MAKKGIEIKFITLIFLGLLAIGIVLLTVSPLQPEEDTKVGLYYSGLSLTVVFGLLFGYSFLMMLNHGTKVDIF